MSLKRLGVTVVGGLRRFSDISRAAASSRALLIVDGDQQQVEVWPPDAREPIILRDRLTWRHPALDNDCVIDLVRLFDVG